MLRRPCPAAVSSPSKPSPSSWIVTTRSPPRSPIETSARRYKALGRAHVFKLYVRNFWWETIHHRPKDVVHHDVRL